MRLGAGSKDDHYGKDEAVAWAKRVLAEITHGLAEDLAKNP